MRKLNVLISGADGFAGINLAQRLSYDGYDVTGLVSGNPHSTNIVNKFCARVVEIDLTKSYQVPMKDIDYVVHLAAITPQAARKQRIDDEKLYNINTNINFNMFELIKTLKPKRSLIISSCAVYEMNGELMHENSALKRKPDAYSTSKIELENLTSRYASEGIEVLILRPFNHFGPGQQLGFLLPDLYKKLSVNRDKINVGNMTSQRDYVDVRDIATAYSKLLFSPNLIRGDVYNVCSGLSTNSISILKSLIKSLDYTTEIAYEESVISNPRDMIVGSAEKIRNSVGWRSSISIEQSIADYIASA